MEKEISATSPDLIHHLFRRSDLYDYRKRLIRLSAWVYFLSLGLIFFVSKALPPDQVYWPVVYFILATGIPAAFTLALAPWHPQHLEWLLALSLYSIVKIGLLIAVTGGSQSPFFPLYLFVLILSASFFTGRSFLAVILLMIAVFAVSQILQRPWRLDLDHLISLPVYIVTALITNFLLRGFHRRSDQAWRQAGRLEGLYEASRLLYAESTLQPPFDVLLEVARRGVDAQRAAICVVDEMGEITAFHHIGLTHTECAFFKNILIDSNDLETLLNQGSPSENGAPSPRVGKPLIVPIVLADVEVGRIYLSDKFQNLPFTSEDEAMVVTLAQDITLAIERTRLRKKIQALATTDGLTGLNNYRVLIDRLAEEIERASRYGHPCALIMADIDNFKGINDTHGHPAGDSALKAIAGLIRQLGRSSNFPARYGGDEFAILLPETDKKAALVAAERFRNAASGLAFEPSEGGGSPLLVSIGVAAFPEDALDSEALIKAADAALYQAKRLGKNRVAW